MKSWTKMTIDERIEAAYRIARDYPDGHMQKTRIMEQISAMKKEKEKEN